ncbi:Gfo/Idh/MocA family protein [Rubinisphaera sp. JC750]|uniref:Gfo/Idh/MocA family protein n=1 Tax=Rubinisphaera sp. JC750 TaxID=2898658 RepID=UPI001F284F8F|nr:Gfo/Idh/MocA family oxidoreductase [Rubinisphaera sp. JC750]
MTSPSEFAPVRVAVVGVGALGRHHARILAGLPGVSLVAVVDPNEEQGRAVAEQHNTTWMADYREAIPICDALSIVAPTFLHHEIASACLEQGRDLLVEKPLTADLGQAERLIDLAQEHDCILQVGHIERFNPAFELLSEALSSVPRYIRAERLSPFPFRSLDIGAIHDLMIHDIELTLHLAGALPTRVEATGSKIMGAHEDMVQARLVFPDGCIADLTASRVNPDARRQIQVWSSTESLFADLQTRTVQVQRPTSTLLEGPAMETRMRAGEDVADLKTRVFGEFIETEELQGAATDQLTAELSEFVDCIRRREQPRVTGETGRDAVHVAEQILEALEQNCVNVRPEIDGTKQVA